MVSHVRRCGLTDAIINSSLDAYEEYLKICDHTMGVFDTPEYWYTTAITRGIAETHTSKNIYPVLEDSVESIRTHSGSNPGRLPNNLRKNGRADIALWKYGRKDGVIDWIPLGFIEVKRGRGWGNKFQEDVDRITSSLERSGKKHGHGTLSGGFFVVVSDYWAESEKEIYTKFEKDFDAIWDKIENAVGDDHVFNGYWEHSECYGDDEKTMGAVMVFKIK